MNAANDNAARRRVGFVDHTLESFHANTFLSSIRGELKDRGFVVAGCTAMNATEGRAWATKNGVRYFESDSDLNEHVDGFMILAPSNPEVHLELCERIFPFRKPTYVDKPCAQDLATVRKIFALADRYGVATQTSSALRYTNVQQHLRSLPPQGARHMTAWAPGRSFQEYGIHPVELIISCMGADATALMRRGDQNFIQLLIEFSGGRSAVANLHVDSDTRYAATVSSAQQTRHVEVDTDKMWESTVAAILDLIESGTPVVERRESLRVRQILDVADNPAARNQFIKLDELR